MFIVVVIALILIYLVVEGRLNIKMPHPGLQAGVDALKAMSLEDGEVMQMARKFVEQSDAKNIVEQQGPYAHRLEQLSRKYLTVNGVPLNFKVYKTPNINAFATADGSIRIFSGLMDMVTDDELMAIVGHEMAHIRNSDTLSAMRKAYLASAARNAMSAAGGAIGSLTGSQLGGIGEKFFSSQFSQQQEFEADDFSFGFLVRNGYDPYAMGDVLSKIDKVAGRGGKDAKLISALFSTHPQSAERAARMRRKADAHLNAKRPKGQ